MASNDKYLLQIAFRNEEERLDILQRGLDALGKGNIPKKALVFGKKYRKWIESAFCSDVEIRFVSDAVGHGIFAKALLKKGAYIGEYTGIIRTNTRTYFAPLNDYCYEYPIPDRLGRSFVIDATSGNFTRFINHSYTPNLKPHYAFFDGFYHCIFLAMKDIQKEEQLCYDYGSCYWVIREHPEPLKKI